MPDPIKKPTNVSDLLRLAVEYRLAAGDSLSRIAHASYRHPCGRDVMKRFLDGGGINLVTAERMARAVGLRLTLVRPSDPPATPAPPQPKEQQ